MKNGSKSKDWVENRFFATKFCSRFFFYFQFVKLAAQSVAIVWSSRKHRLQNFSSDTAPTPHAYLDMIGIV